VFSLQEGSKAVASEILSRIGSAMDVKTNRTQDASQERL